MKNLKLHSIVTMFLIVGMTAFTSCGKDSVDISDKDEVGTFSLTVNGAKEEGTNVFSGAVVGIRTISAKNSNIELGILINEAEFKAGTSIDLAGSSCYIKLGDKTALSSAGNVKVVSTSKIEINNALFVGYGDEGDTFDVTVSGYISSK